MIGLKSLIVGLVLAHVAVADLDLSDNVYLQHMISSRAAPFKAPTYLPPVENLVCHRGDVCVQASECVDGHFSTELAYTKQVSVFFLINSSIFKVNLLFFLWKDLSKIPLN